MLSGGFTLAKEWDLENQLKETVCFLAPNWGNVVLFEVANQLVTCNFIISGHKALGDTFAFPIFVSCFNPLEA